MATIEKKKSMLKTFSVLLDRARLAARVGLQFGEKRDLYEVYGYKRLLTHTDFAGKYRRQDITKRIIDMYPRATWSTPPVITGDEPFNTKWDEVKDKFSVFQVLQRADRLLGFGEYSVIIIGLDDGADLSIPVSGGDNNIIYLHPFGQSAVSIVGFEDDATNERFGKPTSYQVRDATIKDRETGKSVFRRKQFLVHHSRVIHIVEDPLDNEVFSVPRMEVVYNLLEDLLKMGGGTAETYWLTANRGLQADVNPEMSFTKEEADALGDELDEYQHQLRRFIRTRGVKINSLGSDVPDPRGAFDVVMKLISGATGIPLRILLGAEAGQLASQQDRANWANRIEERRVNFADPFVLKPLFRALLSAGVIPSLPTDIVWSDAFKMNPFERSQTSAQVARSAANLTKAMDTNPKIMTIEEARGIISFGDIKPIFGSKKDDMG